MTMTREEQRAKAAHEYIQSDSVAAGNEILAFGDFINGAKWADFHPNWIPVEERLHEENTAPLVRMDLTEKFGSATILYDVVVFDRNGFHTSYNVTHWMEIVPPRKEVNNDNE